MAKGNQQQVERRQTRSKNATTHPGRILLEAQAGRRKPEEIENEKKAKGRRRQARKDKEAREEAAVFEIAEYEHQMALEDKETNFPRRQPSKLGP